MLIALRFIANILFLVAAVALVADLTPVLQGVGPAKLTAFSGHWTELSPRSLKAVQTAVSSVAGGVFWTYGLGAIIALPTAILFAIIGTGFGYLGRRRKRTNIFVN